jgi:hypothetical protein
MSAYHQELASGKWSELTFAEQMGNIGSEVSRMIKWRKKNKEIAYRAFERMLELLDLTLAGLHEKYRLREVARARELLVGAWMSDSPESETELEGLNRYFFQFAILANSR